MVDTRLTQGVFSTPNVVLVSGVQQSDLVIYISSYIVIYIYIYTFSDSFPS